MRGQRENQSGKSSRGEVCILLILLFMNLPFVHVIALVPEGSLRWAVIGKQASTSGNPTSRIQYVFNELPIFGLLLTDLEEFLESEGKFFFSRRQDHLKQAV